jgi:hypothetical protein
MQCSPLVVCIFLANVNIPVLEFLPFVILLFAILLLQGVKRSAATSSTDSVKRRREAVSSQIPDAQVPCPQRGAAAAAVAATAIGARLAPVARTLW